MSRLTIAEAARLHMLEIGKVRVCHGDSHLLHEINAKARRPARGWRTEAYVLEALGRSDLFEKTLVRTVGKRVIRCFWLKEAENQEEELRRRIEELAGE